MVVLHMGALHPVEQALTVVLAVGPFVILWVASRVLNKRQAADQLSGTDTDRHANEAQAADDAGAEVSSRPRVP